MPTKDTIDGKVAEIWTDVLGDASGTFFELRGQSISAVRIAARIEDELDIEVDVGLLFEDPDLASFTQAVHSAAEAAA